MAKFQEFCAQGHKWTPETTRWRVTKGYRSRLCRLCIRRIGRYTPKTAEEEANEPRSLELLAMARRGEMRDKLDWRELTEEAKKERRRERNRKYYWEAMADPVKRAQMEEKWRAQAVKRYHARGSVKHPKRPGSVECYLRWQLKRKEKREAAKKVA